MSEIDNNVDKENKLEDILKSIKGIIETQNDRVVNSFDSDDSVSDDSVLDRNDGYQSDEENYDDTDSVLELKQLAESRPEDENRENAAPKNKIVKELDEEDSLISREVKNQTAKEFQKVIQASSDAKKARKHEMDPFDQRVNAIMLPLIKDWLNNNLPRVVEKVVSEEVKKIIPKL